MISHIRLLDFSYEKSDIEDVELGKIDKYTTGDTLVAHFYLELPPRCLEIGNVVFSNDTVELQIGHACNPHKVHRNRKKSVYTFEFKILNTKHLERKNFRIREFVNEMEG